MLWLSSLVLVFTLTSCEKKFVKRQYQEVVVQALAPKVNFDHSKLQLPEGHPPIDQSSMPIDNQAMNDMLDNSSTETELHWTTPEGWNEGKSNGMRLATFATVGQDPIECTIVALGGEAGGLTANVKRWMNQINLINISDDQVDQFLNQAKSLTSEGGLEMKILDFNQLQMQSSDDTPSMMAALITVDDRTIFVKMTGAKSAITANQTQFEHLCRSLKK